MPLPHSARLEAYDAGVKAALRHAIDGTRLHNPFGKNSRAFAWWNKGMRNAHHALRPVMEAFR